MNNNKVIALVLGAIAALWLLLRFVLLSQTGVPGFFYFGLPIGGIGVVILLLRLGLLNSGDKPGGTIQHWQHSGVQAPPLAVPLPVASQPPFVSRPPLASQLPASSVSQRLQELETLRASGAISDTEYTAKRLRIISDM
jgi:hypothetical protein